MNALTAFNPQAPGLPAHISADPFGLGSNIENRQTVPSLGYEGKVWSISLNGEKTRLIKRNADGDEEPVSIMRVVILDFAKRRGRAYYTGDYDPAKVSAPICWSDDGIAPDASLPGPDGAFDPDKPHKVSAACASCPMSVKGSKITANGKSVPACSEHRMIAVVPAQKLDMEPLRLKIAVTSDYDGQSPDAEAQGWFAFKNYTDYLKTRGVPHTAYVATKIKFDPNVAYPKLFFATDRWLDPETELPKVAELVKAEKTQQLLAGTWTPAGVDGVPKAAAVAPAVQPAAAAPVRPAPVAPPVVEDDEDEGELVIAALPAEAVVQEPAQAAQPAPKRTARPKPEPTVAAAKAETVTPAVSTVVPPELTDLLAEWGD